MNRSTAAQQLMVRGQLNEAVTLLKAIVADQTETEDERASAYHLLGTLTRIDPTFGDGDECGLEHFKNAIRIDPQHLESLHGIVDTFGPLPCYHQDVEAAVHAASTLRSMTSLPDFVIEALKRFEEKINRNRKVM